jgi:quercetin dioxygenase-like cupin family protein
MVGRENSHLRPARTVSQVGFGLRGGVAPARRYIAEFDEVLTGSVNPGAVFDFETDLEDIATHMRRWTSAERSSRSFGWGQSDGTATSRSGVNQMEIQQKLPTVKAPAETFTGDVWLDVIARGEEPSRVRVSVVRFAPGARNAWHAHAVGQTLHVTEGLGRVQSRSGEVIEIRPGDTIYTPPDEWHWHGAAPDHFMTHLAIWEAPAEGAESEWGEQVTNAEYLGHAAEPTR